MSWTPASASWLTVSGPAAVKNHTMLYTTACAMHNAGALTRCRGRSMAAGAAKVAGRRSGWWIAFALIALPSCPRARTGHAVFLVVMPSEASA